MVQPKAKYKICTGFPQGGVCSAKFWIIAFDLAIKIINLNGLQMTASCLYTGKIRSMRQPNSKGIEGTYLLKRHSRIRSQPKKTVAVIFTRSNRLVPLRKIIMNGSEIEYSQSTK